jgi:hypothetical protein
MFPFILGGIMTAGLLYGLRGRHGGPPRGWGAGGPWGRHAGLRWLFRRLGTSPGQEEVLRQAADEVATAWRPLQEEIRAARPALARALEGEQLDEAALRDAFARQDAALAGARTALVAGLGRVHATLDADQRRALASLLASGPGCRFRGAWRHGGSGRAAGTPHEPRSV